MPDGLIAEYCFNETKGNQVHDSIGISPALDLMITPMIKSGNQAFLEMPDMPTLLEKDNLVDAALNLIAFIPFGFCLHATLRTRFGLSIWISAVAILLGAGFTTGIESLQYFSATRHSSMLDIINNQLGTILGVFADRHFFAFLTNWFKAG